MYQMGLFLPYKELSDNLPASRRVWTTDGGSSCDLSADDFLLRKYAPDRSQWSILRLGLNFSRPGCVFLERCAERLIKWDYCLGPNFERNATANKCFYRVTVKICIGDWNCNGWHWLIDPKFISIFPNSKNIVFISGPGYRVLGNLVFVWSSETEQSKFSMLPSRKISVLLTHIGKYRKLFPKNGRWLRGYSGNFFQKRF